MKIKEKIKEVRTTLGLSQKRFAEVAGLSATAIYYYERGKRIPRDQSLNKILQSFHISPKKFFNSVSIQTERYRRKVEIDEKWLRTFYIDKRMTAAQIAQMRGCSKSAVLARLREFDIQRRPRFGHAGPQKVSTYPEVVSLLSSDLRYAAKVVKILTNKEELVLKKRLGILGENVHTLQQIGNRMDLTRERIRQIQNSALMKIAESLKTNRVMELV